MPTYFFPHLNVRSGSRSTTHPLHFTAVSLLDDLFCNSCVCRTFSNAPISSVFITIVAEVNSTALLALLPYEFCAVFTLLGSAVRVVTLYDFAVTTKHAIWWQKGYCNRCYCYLLKSSIPAGLCGRCLEQVTRGLRCAKGVVVVCTKTVITC
jgi:hypothetical protein